MQTFLLNSPVLTGYGTWKFDGPLRVERARQILAEGVISAVGHEAAARFLGRLLEADVPVNRTLVDLQVGDRAIVLRLKQRLPEGKVLTSAEMLNFPFELGLLTSLTRIMLLGRAECRAEFIPLRVNGMNSVLRWMRLRRPTRLK